MKRIVLAAAWTGALLSGLASAQKPADPAAVDVELHNQVIRQALAAVAPFKTQVEQYFLHNKKFPSSNAELGMNPPQAYRNQDVQAIAIGDKGLIDITLTAGSGVDGGVIRLTPAPSSSGGVPAFEWNCRSASYTNIGDASGGTCEYTNQP